jgi:hypothetical protein
VRQCERHGGYRIEASALGLFNAFTAFSPELDSDENSEPCRAGGSAASGKLIGAPSSTSCPSFPLSYTVRFNFLFFYFYFQNLCRSHILSHYSQPPLLYCGYCRMTYVFRYGNLTFNSNQNQIEVRTQNSTYLKLTSFGVMQSRSTGSFYLQ